MEKIPNIGLGPLRFGMIPSQVQAVLGSHRTYGHWMGGNLLAPANIQQHNHTVSPSCIGEHSRLASGVISEIYHQLRINAPTLNLARMLPDPPRQSQRSVALL